MHPEAVKKIENKIKGSLINCQIKDGRPQPESFVQHVNSLGKEIIKHQKEWIDLFDVMLIFYDLVYEVIEDKTDSGEKLEGNLWDILGEEDGQKLKESIKNYFISIPRTYDIYIPIPNISQSLTKSINLSNNISLAIFKEEKQVPGGCQKGYLPFAHQLELNKIYCKQRLTGYCGERLENISLKRAINNFKILLQQGIFFKLFKILSEGEARVGLLRMIARYQTQNLSLISVDMTSDSTKPMAAVLPLDFSRLLNSIFFDSENELLAKAKETGKFEIPIVACLKKAIELIECDVEESERVKSAILWCFDSYIVENKTLAFLQVCLGLEALLGDDGKNGPLSTTLADRCSYLISDDIKSRKTIKDRFKQLYGIRSKLVHGNVIELDSSQKGYLNWGRKVLEYAISKEIEHLNLGKTQ